MARAVVPSTAAAVDHADTELIGHDGQLGDTGFLCDCFYYHPGLERRNMGSRLLQWNAFFCIA